MKRPIWIVVIVIGIAAVGYFVWNIGGLLKGRSDEATAFANTVAASLAKWDMAAVSGTFAPKLLQTYTIEGDQKWSNYRSTLGDIGTARPCSVHSIGVSTSKGTEAEATCPIDYPKGKASLELTVTDPQGKWAISEFELRL